MRLPHGLLLSGVAVLAIVAAWTSCAGPMADRADSNQPLDPLVHPDPLLQLPEASRDRVRPGAEPVPATADDALHTVSVRVALPGDQPLVGAEVVVTSRSVDWGATPRTLRLQLTGAEGRVRFQLPEGGYVVRGRHDDFQIIGEELDVPAGDEIRLTAGRGPRVVISVRDEAGEPVADALVWEAHNAAGRVATTDADGRADLGRVYPSNPFVIVDAPGYERWSNYVFGSWEGRDLFERTVTLSRDVTVDVIVLDDLGAPAPDMEVRSGEGSAVSGPDGRATVRMPTKGSSGWLRAETRDGRQARATIPLPPADDLIVELRLEPPRPCRGRVVNAWTDAPVVGAQVFAHPEYADGFVPLAVTDRDGRFEAGHLDVDTDDTVRILAFADGLGPTGEDWTDYVGPDEDGSFTLRVAPTMRVSGRVTNASGNPIGEANLRLMTRQGDVPFGVVPPEATSAGDGTFTLAGVPAVPGLIVAATDGRGVGWHDQAIEIPGTPGGTFDVGDLVIPEGFDLDVPVVDDAGDSVASAIVWIRWRIVARGMPSAHRVVVDGRMDAVIDLPRDGAVAEISGPGLLDTVRRVDATTERLVASLPCTVSGRVVHGATGEPVVGAWVIVESKDQLHTLDGNHGGAQTAADGTFTFGGVRAGRYRLRVRDDADQARECDRAEVDVTAYETDLGTLHVE